MPTGGIGSEEAGDRGCGRAGQSGRALRTEQPGTRAGTKLPGGQVGLELKVRAGAWLSATLWKTHCFAEMRHSQHWNSLKTSRLNQIMAASTTGDVNNPG